MSYKHMRVRGHALDCRRDLPAYIDGEETALDVDRCLRCRDLRMWLDAAAVRRMVGRGSDS
jgi:hypothetical protein